MMRNGAGRIAYICCRKTPAPFPHAVVEEPFMKPNATLHDRIQQVSPDRLRHDLFYLSQNPLPFRKVNYTRPGQTMHSLAEADTFIRAQLESAGWGVRETRHQVQAYRCDDTKPLHHWYAKPPETDPFFEVSNLEAVRTGREHPEEIIQLISHKDSMSWIDSPGAHDNACGTAANLEIARCLAGARPRRTVRILFCNEEHTPWTSRFAAESAAARGDRIIAVLNQDSLCSKSDKDRAAGRVTHCVAYSTDEGRPLAEHIERCARRYIPALPATVAQKTRINDDEGMFIRAGFATAVINQGSLPNADAQYHLPGDTPDRVDIENLKLSTQLVLAAVLEIDSREQAFAP